MKTPYLIALGGNALHTPNSSGSHADQYQAALDHIAPIATLARLGHPLVITHGNGPQSGSLLLQQEAAKDSVTPQPLHSLVAMTQGQIGYILESALRNHLGDDKITISTIMTMVEVSASDPAFTSPTKPIGPFFTKAELDTFSNKNVVYREDAGRGYRRVVPSPKPQHILSSAIIKHLLQPSQIIIAGGGGGVPVIKTASGYTGVDAVIDKDFTSMRLAEELMIPHAIVLTGVPKAYIHFNTPQQKPLETITVRQAESYLADNQFGKGSMSPKIEAAVSFIKAGGSKVTITDAANLQSSLDNTSGTHIVA